jgi:hypothetical protein
MWFLTYTAVVALVTAGATIAAMTWWLTHSATSTGWAEYQAEQARGEAERMVHEFVDVDRL